MATLDDIKVAVPEPTDEIRDLANEFDRLKDLKRFINSNIGKEFIEVLRGNCERSLVRLVREAKEKPELSMLVSIIMDYSANLDLLAKMREVNYMQEIDDQLVEAVKRLSA